MSLMNRRSPIRILLSTAGLLAAFAASPAAADVGGIPYLMPVGSTEQDARDHAADVALDPDLLWFGSTTGPGFGGRTEPDEQNHTTDPFKVGAGGVTIAAFSDDGVDAYVTDVTDPDHPVREQALPYKGRGQALPKIEQSFHRLEFDFQPNRTYTITLDYSNTHYTGSGDVDGGLLIAYAGMISVELEYEITLYSVEKGVANEVAAHKAVVGKYNGFLAQLNRQPPKGAKVKYEWRLGGDAIKSYYHSAGIGKKIPHTEEDLSTEGLLQVYWIAGGFKSVTVIVTIDGVTVRKSIGVSVSRPTATLKATPTKNNPVVGLGRMTTDDVPPVLAPYLHYGFPQPPGIEWEGTVSAKADQSGEIAFVQLVNCRCEYVVPQTTVEREKGTYRIGRYDEWLLDNGGNPNTPKTPSYGGEVGIAASKTQSIKDEDSPGARLYDYQSSVTEDKRFKLYLMYRPASAGWLEPSIWVTLRKLDWHEKAEVERKFKAGHVDGWTLNGNPSHNANPLSQDSTELPQWTHTFDGRGPDVKQNDSQ